jgi:hypothetical protein
MTHAAAPVHALGSRELPRVVLADGTVSALKWAALLLMTADHVNTYLLQGRYPWVFAAARVVMPIFGFVLAYNLARPDALQRGVHLRLLKRLVVYGAAACPFYYLLYGGIWPLNVLWLLATATFCIYCIERQSAKWTAAAVVVALAMGAWAEFFWFGLIYCIGAFWYCRHGSRAGAAWWLIGAISLGLVNRNEWALLVFPILYCATQLRLRMPRVATFFYAYYPLHLAVIAALVYSG